MTVDSWFKSYQSVKQLFLDFFDIGCETPVKLANPEVNHGAVNLFVIAECHLAHDFVRVMADRIEKPLQIPKDSGFVTLDTNDPLVAALFSVSRVVIRQTIEQTRL
jgi:hypothetical protein